MPRAAYAVALLFFGTSASAQTLTNVERSARVSLLARASEARQAGHIAEALALVQQAERIGATAGTRMFDSQLHAQLGQFADAHTSAEQCLHEVDLDTQTSTANRQAIRTACEAVRTEALRHVGRLVVRVAAGAPEALRVQVNGQLLRPALYGIEQLMNVGAVSVTATLSGAPPWERRETVAAGSTVTLEVVVPVPTVESVSVVRQPPEVVQPRPIPANALAAATPTATATPPATPSRGAGAGPWVVMGIGVAAVTSAGLFYALAASARDARDEACAVNGCQPVALDHDTRYGGYLLATNVALGAGAAAALAGGLWWLLARPLRGSETAGHIVVQPVAGTSNAGMSLRVTF